MLVLSGVTGSLALLQASVGERPHYVAADVSGLYQPINQVEISEQPEWSVKASGDHLFLSYQGIPLASTVDKAKRFTVRALAALRTLCAVWWARGEGKVYVEPRDDTIQAVCVELGLISSSATTDSIQHDRRS
jgi:glycerol-1-phosphatase